MKIGTPLLGRRIAVRDYVPEDLASCALLEKCGFRAVRESSFKKYHMDVQFDSIIYQKTL